MDVDDDDDFYGAEYAENDNSENQAKVTVAESTAKPSKEEDLEEGEEEDDAEEEDSDSVYEPESMVYECFWLESRT